MRRAYLQSTMIQQIKQIRRRLPDLSPLDRLAATERTCLVAAFIEQRVGYLNYRYPFSLRR